MAERIGSRRLALITDETVLALLAAWGVPDLAALPLAIPPGEESKTRERWLALSDALLDTGFGRDSAILAIGGGVVGDLAGFVAATYLRGIPHLAVPTTLLAMLDASVGGKVGVDTPRGKNLIGAFHPPVAVVADPAVLATLPERTFRAGLAEAVKHGVIADREYFAWMERESGALLSRDPAALERLVVRSVEIKAAVVEQDEREAGRRAVLNAGHTVAHALEQVSDWNLPHGEAVSLGLVVESRLAERLGVAPSGLADRVAALLATLGLPTRLNPAWRTDRILAAMSTDKKNRGGNLRAALPSGMGEVQGQGGEWTTTVSAQEFRTVLAESV